MKSILLIKYRHRSRNVEFTVENPDLRNRTNTAASVNRIKRLGIIKDKSCERLQIDVIVMFDSTVIILECSASVSWSESVS